jgi:hypothetical protein
MSSVRTYTLLPSCTVLLYIVFFYHKHSRTHTTQQQRAREACDRQCTLAKQQIDAAQTKVQGATAAATAAGTAAATLCRATLDSASEVCGNSFHIVHIYYKVLFVL